jgi:MFS family permease
VFSLGLVVAIPVMLFWARYSTRDRMTELYRDIAAQAMTVPAVEAAPDAGRVGGLVRRCMRDRTIILTAGNTLVTQIVYMGINLVLPLYLANIAGFSFAASAGLSVVFTLTGIIGQVLWPSISDYLGRRTTLIICGVWMAIGVGAFYFAGGVGSIIAIQLFFGLVANAVWPVYYAAASDAAPQEARSTANGIITTAMFVGGGIVPVLMGWLVALGGGWEASTGYVIAFLFMAGCALAGALFQLFTRESATADEEPRVPSIA